MRHMVIHPIKAWRDQSGMKQGFLAKRLGVVQSTLSDIERFKRHASLALARKIAEFTGLTLDQVLTRKPDAN